MQTVLVNCHFMRKVWNN